MSTQSLRELARATGGVLVTADAKLSGPYKVSPILKLINSTSKELESAKTDNMHLNILDVFSAKVEKLLAKNTLLNTKEKEIAFKAYLWLLNGDLD